MDGRAAGAKWKREKNAVTESTLALGRLWAPGRWAGEGVQLAAGARVEGARRVVQGRDRLEPAGPPLSRAGAQGCRRSAL